MNNLTRSSPQIDQPKTLKIKLKDHQKTSIYAMNELEQKGEIKIKLNSYINSRGLILVKPEEQPENILFRGLRFNDLNNLNYEPIDYIINTNFGILSDKVGSGKTFTVLGLISEHLVPPNNPKLILSSNFTSIKYINKTLPIKTNLILIPHGLTTQWYNAFKKTSLKMKLIHRQTALKSIKSVYNIFGNENNDNENKKENDKKENDKIDNDKKDSEDSNNSFEKIKPEETIEYYDVILVSSTFSQDFINKYKEVKWARIIIDEVLTIKLPAEIPWNCNFIWFITATPSGLEYINKSYIRNIFSCMQKILFNYLVVKNNDEYISESMNLPDFNQIIVRCFTSKVFGIIKHYVSDEVINMLNAGNITEAISKINCNADNQENIFKAITLNLEKDIHNKKAQLAYNETIIPQDAKAHEENINKLKIKIASLESRYNSIKEKIEKYQEECCPICLEDLENPAVMKCCSNIFCLPCLTSVKGLCPMCRKPFELCDLNIIIKEGNELKKKDNKQLLSKKENLLNIINKNKHGKFLIFSCYENTNDNISQVLKENNIIFSKLIGASTSISKTIDKFNKGEITVLLLNAQYYGSGLNLQMATDIIIYHEMNKELETQIIGRGQRIGRKDKLNIYYLLHENENHNVVNPSLDISITDLDDKRLIDFISSKNENIFEDQEEVLDSDEEALERIKKEKIKKQDEKKVKKTRKVRNVI